MKNSRDLSEVYVRLEQAYVDAEDDDMTQQEQFDLYETIAIQILDSEFDDYEEGLLEEYLVVFLDKKVKSLKVDR
jgi:hypothetical protein